MATALRVRVEGEGARERRQRAKLPLAVRRVDVARRAITLGLGCGIPCLSLALSSIGGRLLTEQHYGLGGAALVLCCAVLAVSLSHLAAAIRDITRSAAWQSWALAVACDVSLVLGELASVAGFTSVLVPVVMCSVCGVSAVLNCWAFVCHRGK